MTRPFTLGKHERLKSKKRIEQLFSDGKNFSVATYRIFYHLNKVQGPLLSNVAIGRANVRFGVGVSGKNFKKAVDRNKIKRLTRESYRLQKKELLEMASQRKQDLDIFLVYTGKSVPDFNTVKEKVNVILKRLIAIVHENLSPDT